MRMIRTPRFVLVRHHHANYLDELYDLETDPGQVKNLYHNAKYRETRDGLQTRLTAWQRSINDPLLSPLTTATFFRLPPADGGFVSNIYLDD